jgi:tetratricopeptide (TPR) repeat protein
MRYKPAAEPNKILSQRFTALAGLIEVGDREFDQIYEIDERRRRELVDLAQINEAAPEPTAEPARPLPDVEQRIPTLREANEPIQPRDLIASGRYSDAIVRYNLLIEREPRQFAHYLGRAKARFLSGDAAGALVDIQAAETINPGHRFIARLQDLIAGRTIETKPAAEASLAVRLGHTALRDGNASAAFEKYAEAEKLGFNPVFSVFNLAMARFIGMEFELSQRTLDRIEPYPGSALEFNVITLRTLCYIMAGGKEVQQSLERVRSSLEMVRASIGYVYNARSPLIDLEQGTRKVFDGQEMNKIEGVFKILHTASPRTAERDIAPTTIADQGND